VTDIGVIELKRRLRMSSGGSHSFGRKLIRAPDNAPEKVQVTLAKSLCGAVIGPGGQRIRWIRRDSGASIIIGKETENEDRVITLEGTSKQIQIAQYLLQQAVKLKASDEGIAEGFGDLDNNEPRERQQVSIPKSMAGAIIGFAGNRIDKIRRDSEALITISEMNEEDERVITVEGTEKQRQTALYLLQQAVKEPGDWEDHAELEMDPKAGEDSELKRVDMVQFLEESIKKKEENLECPVCLEAATEPIFGCKEFHLICSSCKLKPDMTKCPTCRVEFGKGGPVRNRFAEREAQELLELKEQLDRINSA